MAYYSIVIEFPIEWTLKSNEKKNPRFPLIHTLPTHKWKISLFLNPRDRETRSNTAQRAANIPSLDWQFRSKLTVPRFLGDTHSDTQRGADHIMERSGINFTLDAPRSFIFLIAGSARGASRPKITFVIAFPIELAGKLDTNYRPGL